MVGHASSQEPILPRPYGTKREVSFNALNRFGSLPNVVATIRQAATERERL